MDHHWSPFKSLQSYKYRGLNIHEDQWIIHYRGRDSMSKVEGLSVHEAGGYLMFIQFWGGSAFPLSKSGGAEAPPAPPGSLPLH